MQIAAKDPDEYVASVPEERRPHLEHIRKLVRSTVPDADEKILWGMIGYEIHGRPFAAVASQKASMSLYLMDLYTQPELAKEHAAALSKVSKGKSCLHFQRAGDLPLEVVAKILKKAPSIQVELGTLAGKRKAKSPRRAEVVELRPPKPKTSKRLAVVDGPSKKPTAKPKKTARKPTK
jgi:uncharacterized protein YdhG (YjbR/CyaY superfamily)